MFIIYYLFGPLFVALGQLFKERKISFEFLGKLKFWLISLASILFCYLTITVTLLDFTATLDFTPLTLLIAILSSTFFVIIWLALPWIKEKQSFIACLVVSLCIALFSLVLCPASS